MYQFRLFTLCAVCLIYANLSIGQSAPPPPALLPVGPQSPEAASLQKFGNIPVSYQTGIPNITIPIYTINIGKITLPISLDYHAGGIKVDEVSGCAGIGWALNAGGSVARTMVGFPDDASNGYLNSPAVNAILNTPANYWNTLYNNSYDYNQDFFSYSVAGQAGKFILNQDKSIFQMPVSSNIITYNTDPYGIIVSFSLTDDNGIQYIFENEETSTMLSAPFSYVSTWDLTKIIGQNTIDTIFLSYESYGQEISHTRDDNFNIGYFDWLNTSTGDDGTSAGDVEYSMTQTSNTAISSVQHSNSYVKQITWRGGEISFIHATDRLDCQQDMRLSEIQIYSNVGSLKMIRDIKLNQSYFYYNSTTTVPPTAEQNYRLRLDSVTFDSPDTLIKEKYRMTYNTTPMATRETCAQDNWGFNNGQFLNNSMMVSQNILYNDVYLGGTTTHTIGSTSCNRNPDSTYMQACTLQSIQYPTGGKTLFQLETHHYMGNSSGLIHHVAVADAVSSSQNSATTSFTPDLTYLNVQYSIYITGYNPAQVTSDPSVSIVDNMTGNTLVVYVNTNSSQTYTLLPTSLPIVTGHTYTLNANVNTTSGLVIANISVGWDAYSTVTSNMFGGGLRVKSISNVDQSGNQISKKLFYYGTDGTGIALSPLIYSNIHQVQYQNRFGASIFGACDYFISPPSATYHSNSILPTSQVSGSPILYELVTTTDVSATGSGTNGTSYFQFPVIQDFVAPVNYVFDSHGLILLSNVWENGYLSSNTISQSISGGNYAAVQSNQYNYQTDLQSNDIAAAVSPKYVSSGCTVQAQWTEPQDFAITQYSIPTGIERLHQTISSSYDNTGAVLNVTKTKLYDASQHLYPIAEQYTTSSGELETDSLQYPYNFNGGGNIYDAMIARNIIAPVVRNVTVRNSIQTIATKSDYSSWSVNSGLILPNALEQQILLNPSEVRINFNKFDRFGNIVQQQKTNDVLQSYIWDYLASEPVAKVINADSGSIAYTSFEADGTGNWTITPGGSTAGGITGNNSYTFAVGSSITKGGLATSVTYVVSYWTKNSSAYNVAGTMSGYPIKGKTINGWTYYEHQVSGQTTVSLSGTGAIDELRLYPSGAQMETYTYIPLVGISSGCDADNRVTYYAYDGMGRLKYIKDQDGNIIKTIDYYYKN